MQVSIAFLTDAQCVNTYPEVRPEIKVCGGETGKTVCNVSFVEVFVIYFILDSTFSFKKGDSGGPFVVQSK